MNSNVDLLDLTDLDMEFMATSLWPSSSDVDSLSTAVVDNPLLGSPIGSEPRSPGLQHASPEQTSTGALMPAQQLSPAAVNDPILAPGLELSNTEFGFDEPALEAAKWETSNSPCMQLSLDSDWLSSLNTVKVETPAVEALAAVQTPAALQTPATVEALATVEASDVEAVTPEQLLEDFERYLGTQSPESLVEATDTVVQASAETVSATVCPIGDDALVKCSVKQLNVLLKNMPESEKRMVKQRRRTLKNRGYAQNCRAKRTMARDELETALAASRCENDALRKELADERAARKREQEDTRKLAGECSAWKRLIVAKLQQQRQ